jgi:hypothetical protein
VWLRPAIEWSAPVCLKKRRSSFYDYSEIKTAATSKDEVLHDSQLDSVAGGLVSHKMGPSNYEKKNVTTIRWSPLAGMENEHE